MTKTVQLNPIELLVVSKFPKSLCNESNAKAFGLTPAQFQQQRQDVEAYRQELKERTADEIQTLLDECRAQYQEEQEEKARAEVQKKDLAEKQYFFNQPPSTADFDYWSKAKHWTLDEAIALSFGKDPEIVNWKSVSPLTNISSFAKKYERLRGLALRAVPWKELFDPILPSLFIAWAKRNDISFPEELEEKAIRYGGRATDWKAAYEKLREETSAEKATYEKYIADYSARYDGAMALLDERSALTDKVFAQRDLLLAELETLRADKGNIPEKPLKSKERQTILKLIIGMAIDGYGFDPNASRSPTAREISSSLALLGISIDEDTVRNWLKEAKEVYDPVTV